MEIPILGKCIFILIWGSGIPNSRTTRNDWTVHENCAKTNSRSPVLYFIMSRHVRDVMHVGIANPQWRGYRSRHSGRRRNPQFYVSGKRPKCTVYPKKYAHGFCFAVLCCGYTLTDFPISIRLTSLALSQSNDCPSASKATLMNMDKYFIWIHYERLHNHNKAKHNKTVCIFLGIYCIPAGPVRGHWPGYWGH